MQNFFIDEKFYSDIDDFFSREIDGEYKDDLSDMEDDWSIEAVETDLEPIFKFNIEWITDRIDVERFPEDDDDRMSNKLEKLLESNINFDAINASMPKLHYTNHRKTFWITKHDLLEEIKPTTVSNEN